MTKKNKEDVARQRLKNLFKKTNHENHAQAFRQSASQVSPQVLADLNAMAIKHETSADSPALSSELKQLMGQNARPSRSKTRGKRGSRSHAPSRR
jgi:hypothetical protein